MTLPRFLAAWTWLRWRTLVNALTGRRRSRSGRVAAWVELLLGIVFGLLGLGAATALAVGGWFAGRTLGPGAFSGPAMIGIRVGGAILTVVLAMFSAFAGGRSATSDWTRLLLLPIARRQLATLEQLAGLTDPWLLVAAPALLALAIGLARDGLAAAAVALVAGALFYLTLGALASMISLLVQLLLRNRRRAEVVVMVGMLVVMMIGWLPGLLTMRPRHARGAPGAARRETPSAARPAPTARPPQRTAAQQRANELRIAQVERYLQVVPSEAYARAIGGAARHAPARAALPLAILALEYGLLGVLTLRVWRRLVELPALGSRRRGALALPQLASPASLAGRPAVAIARAQAATVLRSVQGRLAVVMPLLLVVTLSLTAGRHGGIPGFLQPLFGAAAVLAIGPLAVLVWQAALLNQFGIDGAGFSLQVLSPLSDRELVAGRVLAGAVLTAMALGPALLAGLVLRPATPWPLWLATPLAALAAYLMFVPAALWLSLLLPKASDLSKLGNKGKPHGLAAFVGVLVVMVALGCVQGVGIVGLLAGGAWGALLAQAVLSVAAGLIAWPLLIGVAQALPGRRDALLLALHEG